MHNKLSPFTLLLAIALLWTSLSANGEIVITHPEIRETADHYMVNAEFSYMLGEEIIDALQNGIPITFVAEYVVEEITPFWSKNNTVTKGEHRFILSYHGFSGRYYLISLKNNSHGTYGTIEKAIERMTMRHDALIIDKSLLSDKGKYQVKIRSSIDSSKLPGMIRPYVYTPYLWPEWKLDSGWHTILIER
ncbi:MAG: DUF4390 domain-containing protein [Gammaproteobacteria bacterium]|uniref:DUF4390 domain-containing protein n=1 Tax=Candidatus Thiopontia autotrophica TaxID=2841688 RepID=A0A8J6PAY9_9GAMM|nr:DUF4390 domain-containing protein [Candidatus Thiopontia autotrophica]MBL6968792.1 DUF4390 domain-containing protein [Gammaproteobacteria bacterium]